jgi:PhnB protein
VELVPYLFFDGNCEEAFRTYERVLGGTIEAMLSHEETPANDNVPAEWRKKIVHASLLVGQHRLMASDSPPALSEPRSGFRVSINVTDAAEAERIFKELSAGGEVTMPFEQTFFAQRFAMFTDRFGTRWMLNCA